MHSIDEDNNVAWCVMKRTQSILNSSNSYSKNYAIYRALLQSHLEFIVTLNSYNVLLKFSVLVSKTFKSLFACNTACGADSFARPGDASCTSCPPHSKSQQGSASCDCYANYYKASNETCLPCPLNSVSQPGSEMCTCVFGYFRTSGESVSVPCTSEHQ